MKRTILVTVGVVALAAGTASGQIPDNPSPPFVYQGVDGMRRVRSPFGDFNTLVRGAKTYEGLYRLHQKDEHVYMEIRPNQLGQPVLCPIAVARGGGLGGHTLNFDEQWVLVFQRVGNKIHVVRRNVHVKARAGTPVAKAVETTYTDSVLLALRIAAINPMNQQAVVIDLNDIFMTNFAQLNLGAFDANRSAWHKIKAFPRNVELQVQATFAGRRSFRGDDTIDGRGNTVVIHYGLAQLPDGGYQPRVADDRVGYFVSAVKDFNSASKDTTFVRYVRRWRLEPAEPIDPKSPHKLSVPKRSIKFYIEKTVPHEYRAAVQDGILEWNKAFEKVGFRNAIEVVQQRDDEDWDPEDMNYNTFRWITTDQGFAMGPSRSNPLTGEILDADIIFDADMVRVWKHEHRVFSSRGVALDPVSPIQAMNFGWGLEQLLERRHAGGDWSTLPRGVAADPTAARLWAIQHGACDCGNHMKHELGLAAMTLIRPGPGKPGDKVPDELINQAIKHVVMHEVGHTLGLRHNFKASTMLTNKELHDPNITQKRGLVGSVMDYSPVNLAPKGVKQGDYFSTTLGPYDYWAIEYGYKPSANAEELKKIAGRGAAPGHDYGTDEDTFLTADPLINRWDLGSDVLQFAQERMLLAEDLMKGLANRVVDDGEGYQRARVAFSILLSQFGDGAYLVSRYVGGEYAHRDHRGDPKGRDPLVPVTAAKQRAALKFLQAHIFSDKPFQFPPELLRRLAVERWHHWGARPNSTDFPVYDRILGIQRLALTQLLDPDVLRRIQNNALKNGKEEQPLAIADVFRSVTDGIWVKPLNNGAKEEKAAVALSTIRRNLQREHVKLLSNLVLGQKGQDEWLVLLFGDDSSAPPPDARSLARLHLRDISQRIQALLGDRQVNVDETTQAHLEECRERIAKVLDAAMQVKD
jgi:hypothetical protein